MAATLQWILVLLCASMWMAGCTLRPQRAALPQSGARQPFLPATSAPAVIDTSSPQTNGLSPTLAANCTNQLAYISDLTIPDGTVVSPGSPIDKRWLVENRGSCNWDDRYRLKRISGPPLAAADEQSLFPARSGAQAIIRVLLTAPSEPGAYHSAWQAYDPQGNPFGDPIFIEIVVE